MRRSIAPCSHSSLHLASEVKRSLINGQFCLVSRHGTRIRKGAHVFFFFYWRTPPPLHWLPTFSLSESFFSLWDRRSFAYISKRRGVERNQNSKAIRRSIVLTVYLLFHASKHQFFLFLIKYFTFSVPAQSSQILVTSTVNQTLSLYLISKFISASESVPSKNSKESLPPFENSKKSVENSKEFVPFEISKESLPLENSKQNLCLQKIAKNHCLRK